MDFNKHQEHRDISTSRSAEKTDVYSTIIKDNEDYYYDCFEYSTTEDGSKIHNAEQKIQQDKGTGTTLSVQTEDPEDVYSTIIKENEDYYDCFEFPTTIDESKILNGKQNIQQDKGTGTTLSVQTEDSEGESEDRHPKIMEDNEDCNFGYSTIDESILDKAKQNERGSPLSFQKEDTQNEFGDLHTKIMEDNKDCNFGYSTIDESKINKAKQNTPGSTLSLQIEDPQDGSEGLLENRNKNVVHYFMYL